MHRNLVEGVNMKYITSAFLLIMFVTSTGCLMTKAVTVPMRMGGAIISIVPLAGNEIDGAIDKAADKIDELPF